MNAMRLVLAMLVISTGGGVAAAASVKYLGVAEGSGVAQAAVVEGHALAHTGQIMPLDKEGNVVGEGIPSAQLPQVLFNLETALAAAGSDIQHLVKVNVYVDTPRTADEVRKLFDSRFHGPAHPAVSYVCTPLAHPKAQVALDAVAVVPGDGPTTVVRKRCPTIKGDSRQGDVAILPRGDVVYVSGVAEKGENLAAATANNLKSLLATIGHLGLDRSHVVQLKAFVGSVRDAAAVKEQVAKVFADGPTPPLILVQWFSSVPAEMEMIAAAPAKPAAASETVTYFTPPGATASPVFSRVARVQGGKQVYISGLYGDEPGDNRAQIRSIFATLQKILKEAGTDMQHLAKATYYITDEDGADVITKLRREYYDPKRPPAASKAMVTKNVGMSGRAIMVDMIAVTPK